MTSTTDSSETDTDTKTALLEAIDESKKPADSKSVLELLEDREYLIQIERALPPGTSVASGDRFLRIVRTLARKNPRIQECDGASVVGAAMQAAQLGLSPGSDLGECFIVPTWSPERHQSVAEFVLGYKGIIKLAFQSDFVADICSMPVRENDEFDMCQGSGEYRYLMHKPLRTGETGRGQAIGYWALVNYTTGGCFFDYLSVEEINTIRYRFSKNPDHGPWKTDFDSMARKTVIKHIRAHLPLSAETAVGLNADNSVHQELAPDLAEQWSASRHDPEIEVEYDDVAADLTEAVVAQEGDGDA